MRWRTPPIVLLGLLLAVPLGWLLRTVTSGGHQRSPAPQTIPMLSLEERRSLLTYERSCQQPEDCESPLACFFNPRRGIQQNREPHTPGEEGMQDMRIIEALYRSAKEGKSVKLEAAGKQDAFRGPPPAAED